MMASTHTDDDDKLDYFGYFSPEVLERVAMHMHANRIAANGKPRKSDDWKTDIKKKNFTKSLLRHTMDVWNLEQGNVAREDLETALCAIIFNASGRLHKLLTNNKSKHKSKKRKGKR